MDTELPPQESEGTVTNKYIYILIVNVLSALDQNSLGDSMTDLIGNILNVLNTDHKSQDEVNEHLRI